MSLQEIRVDIDRNNHRVEAWNGEKRVGQIIVVPVGFDWGYRTIVPMGGIAGVGTDEAYRRQGISGRMTRRAVEYSRELQYPVGGVSTLHDNVARRLYTRSGYVYLFDVDEYSRAVGCPDPAPPPPGVSVRPYLPGDEEGILALWNRTFTKKGFFGGRDITPSQWIARRSELLAADPNSVWVAVRDGAVLGWAEYYHHAWDRRSCDILVEENTEATSVFRALLSKLERAVNAAEIKRLAFHAARYESAMVERLLEAGFRRTPSHVFHVAVFDFAALLNSLRPLFLKRLQVKGCDSWPGLVRVRPTEGSAKAAGMNESAPVKAGEIELPNGRSGDIVELEGPYESLVRVLCGRLSAREEYLRGHLSVSRNAFNGQQLDALFGRYPWFHPMRDRW